MKARGAGAERRRARQSWNGAQSDTAARVRAALRAARSVVVQLRSPGPSTRLRAVPASPESTVSTSLRVRRAVAGDLRALIALENRSFDSDRLSERQWRRHLANSGADVLVADVDGRVGGAAVVFFRRDTRAARLYSIAVDRSLQGRGVGGRLLGAAERAARRRGCDRLRLEVRVDNAAARRLYEKLGYRRTGVRHAYYEDGADAIRFERMLAPARRSAAATSPRP